MNRPTTRLRLRSLRVPAAASALIAGLVLAGCSASPSEKYDDDAATRLQERVLVATQTASTGDHTTALTTLAELEVELADALARGQITQARYDSVMAAIALVRADLGAAIAATTPPPPTPAPVTSNDDDNSGNEGKGKKGKGNDDEDD
jgi:hypothetical protein